MAWQNSLMGAPKAAPVSASPVITEEKETLRKAAGGVRGKDPLLDRKPQLAIAMMPNAPHPGIHKGFRP